jgi:hypothetical protein
MYRCIDMYVQQVYFIRRLAFPFLSSHKREREREGERERERESLAVCIYIGRLRFGWVVDRERVVRIGSETYW